MPPFDLASCPEFAWPFALIKIGRIVGESRGRTGMSHYIRILLLLRLFIIPARPSAYGNPPK